MDCLHKPGASEYSCRAFTVGKGLGDYPEFAEQRVTRLPGSGF